MTPLEAINNLPLAVALRGQSTAYIVLTSLHVIGIVLMLGSVWLIDFNLLGLTGKVAGKLAENSSDQLSAKSQSQMSVLWSLLGFAVIVASGSVMAFAHAAVLISSKIFLVKLGLITCAAVNMITLHSRDGLNKRDSFSKLQALFSLLLWAGVIAAGQWVSAGLHH